MSLITDPTILNAIDALMTQVETYRESKDVNDLPALQPLNANYVNLLQQFYINNPDIPKHEMFTFEVSEDMYLEVEKHFLDPLFGPTDPVGIQEPEWLMDSPDLGTFTFDEELYIPFEFSDPDLLVTNIRIDGQLPKGIRINPVDFSIYGYVEEDGSSSNEFTVYLETSTGNEYPRTFNLGVINTEHYVEWTTPAHIGTYGIGAVINTALIAESRQRIL